MSARHTLVVYRPSPRADAALRRLVETAGESGGRVTVLRLLAQEPERHGCCDTRSIMWNRVCREFAREDLDRAWLAVEGAASVELDVLPFSGRRPADAVIRAALSRGADEVVLADVGATPIGPLQRRRLRRRSPVPVRA